MLASGSLKALIEQAASFLWKRRWERAEGALNTLGFDNNPNRLLT
jgi:hypothetical protein